LASGLLYFLFDVATRGLVALVMLAIIVPPVPGASSGGAADLRNVTMVLSVAERPELFQLNALIIAIQPMLTQRTSNGTTHWSVGSPLDTTTVQQDRSRFTSHEGEFTITAPLINF
jgi:hypothetical protein